MVAEGGAFDEGADGLLFFGVEVLDAFDVVGDGLGCLSFVGLKEERICAGVERECEAAEDVEGGLAGAGFIAAELGDV